MRNVSRAYVYLRSTSQVPFEPERINALLGTDLTKEEMLCYQVGDIIEITSNANDNNKIFVESA